MEGVSLPSPIVYQCEHRWSNNKKNVTSLIHPFSSYRMYSPMHCGCIVVYFEFNLKEFPHYIVVWVLPDVKLFWFCGHHHRVYLVHDGRRLFICMTNPRWRRGCCPENENASSNNKMHNILLIKIYDLFIYFNSEMLVSRISHIIRSPKCNCQTNQVIGNVSFLH